MHSGTLFGQADLIRQEYLRQLLKVIPEDKTTASGNQLPGTQHAHISPQDFLWKDWLKRTGELPPDFDDLPSLPLLLSFGPGLKAQLHVTLLIPPGDGPFPGFICSWIKDRYDWVQAAVCRGYIGCHLTAKDPKYGYPDDSEEYEKIWWPEYYSLHNALGMGSIKRHRLSIYSQLC
jgi:hypothetical protein